MLSQLVINPDASQKYCPLFISIGYDQPQCIIRRCINVSIDEHLLE